jgi:ESS family glutamate:Na+ symporter
MVREVGDTFATNLAAEFGGFGVALLIGGLLLLLLTPHVASSFAILQPAGFVGGYGYAAAIGTTLEEAASSVWRRGEAVTIGQTFATIGMLSGVFFGLAAINLSIRKNYTRFVRNVGNLPRDVRQGFIAEEKQTSIGKATVNPMTMDPFTWHVLLILMASAGGYYTFYWIGDLLPGITPPMVCLSMLCGVALQKLLGAINLQHTVDKRIVTRIGSSITDYLVAFGIASIEVSVVVDFAVPLLILTVLGVAFSLFFLFVVSKRVFHNYWLERGIFIFGWTTGVVALGVTLLRIVDPEFRSRALEDYGIAYVFISMIELAIVSVLPSIVALGFISGSVGYVLIPGAVMLAISVLLLLVTVRKYGLQSKDGAHRRAGEPDVHVDEGANGAGITSRLGSAEPPAVSR